MEKILKRYFWVGQLGVIVLTAGLFALAASNVAGGLLSPWAVVVPPPQSPSGIKPQSGQPTLAATNEKAWGEEPKPVEPAPEPESAPEEATEQVVEQVEGEYPASDLPVTLTGTMVAGDPSWSMALLIDNSSRASFTARQDESLVEEGARLVKIERDRIVIERAGQLEQIELSEDGQISNARPNAPSNRKGLTNKPLPDDPLGGPSLSTPKPSAASALKSPHEELKQGIKKLNENQFEVSRQTITDAIANPGKFQDGTRPVPNYKGGKVNGFKLVGMKPGSIYYELGIRPGDIITGVNGKPLDSPNRALELFQKLGSLDSVTVDIERNGQAQKKSFTIK